MKQTTSSFLLTILAVTWPLRSTFAELFQIPINLDFRDVPNGQLAIGSDNDVADMSNLRTQRFVDIGAPTFIPITNNYYATFQAHDESAVQEYLIGYDSSRLVAGQMYVGSTHSAGGGGSGSYRSSTQDPTQRVYGYVDLTLSEIPGLGRVKGFLQVSYVFDWIYGNPEDMDLRLERFYFDSTKALQGLSVSDIQAALQNGTEITSVQAIGDAIHIPSPLSPNLLAWWSLDDVTAPGRDDSGHGHHAAVHGNFTSSTGAHSGSGNAMQFAESNYLSVPYHPRLNPKNFTLSVWAYPIHNGNYYSVVTSRHDAVATDNTTYGFILYNAFGTWSFWNGQGQAPHRWHTLDAPSPFTLNEWQHLAITYDDATQTKKLYINGSEVSSATAPHGLNLKNGLHIGGGGDLGNEFPFSGRIDEVSLFDRALTAAEIQELKDQSVEDFARNTSMQIEAREMKLSGGNVQALIRLPAVPAGMTLQLESAGSDMQFSPVSPAVQIHDHSPQPFQITIPMQGDSMNFRFREVPAGP